MQKFFTKDIYSPKGIRNQCVLLLANTQPSKFNTAVGSQHMDEQAEIQIEANVQEMEVNSGRTSLALCLSGGGFRATFFHMGVIKALRSGRCSISNMSLLSCVDKIYAVSGGSILAAHMVLNWHRYTSSDENEFDQAIREVEEFGGKNVRGRIISRWIVHGLLIFPNLIFKGNGDRSQLLENEYDLLFRSSNLSDFRSKTDESKPEIAILSTSFNTGKSCAFTQVGFLTDALDKSSVIEADLFPVARAVAASSAFPALFPPISLHRNRIAATFEALPNQEELTDGGVFDNLGIESFADWEDYIRDEKNFILVSDASLPFEWSLDASYFWLPTRAIRTTDIMMKRVSELIKMNKNIEVKDSKIFTLPIVADKKDFAVNRLRPDYQKRISKIRTDLNHFSTEEQLFLVKHGEEICFSRCQDIGEFGEQGEIAHQIDDQDKANEYLEILEKAKKRPLPFTQFSDWANNMAICLMLFWTILVIGIPSIYFYQEMKRAERAEAEAQDARKIAQQAKDEAVELADRLQSDRVSLERRTSLLIELGPSAGEEQIDSKLENEIAVFAEERNLNTALFRKLFVLGVRAFDRSQGKLINNKYPPKRLWENGAKLTEILNDFERRTKLQVSVDSAYKTVEYNRAQLGRPNSRHLTFEAVDFSASTGKPKDWFDKIRQIRKERFFTGGIGLNPKNVHVDLRSYNAKWEQEVIELPETGNASVLPEDFVVYIQFAGYKRQTIKFLAEFLEMQGWEVPGAEVGGERLKSATPLAEVRFSKANKKAEQAANLLASQVADSGYHTELVAAPNNLVRANVLELWIGYQRKGQCIAHPEC